MSVQILGTPGLYIYHINHYNILENVIHCHLVLAEVTFHLIYILCPHGS
jgi:hypothetical protein